MPEAFARASAPVVRIPEANAPEPAPSARFPDPIARLDQPIARFGAPNARILTLLSRMFQLRMTVAHLIRQHFVRVFVLPSRTMPSGWVTVSGKFWRDDPTAINEFEIDIHCLLCDAGLSGAFPILIPDNLKY